MKQSIIESPPPQPKPEKIVETINGKMQEWTEKGRVWLNRLKGKAEGEPREVIWEVAEAQTQGDLTRESQKYQPEIISATNDFINVGVRDNVRDYLQKYGLDRVNSLVELAKNNTSVFNRIVELGIPPQFAERVCRFESFRSQPKKEGYDFLLMPYAQNTI